MADATAAARSRRSVSPRRSPAVFLACAMATKELKAMSQRLEAITARANIQAVR